MHGAALMAKIRKQPAVAGLWSVRSLVLYATDAAGSAPPAGVDIRIDDQNHIDRFEQTVGWQTREHFLRAFERRRAAGTLTFTIAGGDGPLLAYGFAHPNADEATYSHVDQRVLFPAGTATIYGGFVHPAARGRALHAVLQAARINHLIGTLDMRWVVSGVARDNAAAQASVGKTNLRPVATLTTRRRIYQTERHAVLHNPAFAARFPDAG